MSKTFTITLKPNAFSFSARADESILDAALRQGVALNSGCRRGVCGVCIGSLENGTVRYIDDEEPMAFFDENGGDGKVVVCEARATSDLLLDIAEMQTASLLEDKNLLVTILEKETLSATMTRLLLELPEDEFLQYLPGQDIELTYATQSCTAPLAAAPVDKHSLDVHLPVDPPDSFRQLRKGDQLRVKGPYGDFFLRTQQQKPALFVCDADGFACIKSLIETSLVRGNPHELLLLNFGDAADQPWQREIVRSWRSVGNFKSLDSGDSIAATLQAIQTGLPQTDEFDVYLCANRGSLDEIEFELISIGVRAANIISKPL